MRNLKLTIPLLSLAVVLMTSSHVFGVSSYLTSFNSRYGTSSTALNTCNLCHPGGVTTQLNPYGSAYAGAGHNYPAIESVDSDGDGYTNIVEINARTFPGDAASRPSTADANPPSITAFTIPSTSTTLTVSITTFTVTDNVGVTGYCLTETNSTSSATWTSTKPGSYTFGAAGAKTLYAWARDAAGNVSPARSAGVTITLPTGGDTTPPTVTAFSLPATTATSLTVSINTFTATDNVGVTSYCLAESTTPPTTSTPTCWTSTKPGSYTFGTAGTKTLYAWARDAAGNVSASRSAGVTITLPPGADTTPPTVSGFTISANAGSLAVSITTFSATDNVGVTGYLVNETATKPLATVADWTATVPTGYSFATAGAKTLYAWAKDAAGNVSNTTVSQSVTITTGGGNDVESPEVMEFTLPLTSTSLTVPILAFRAIDNVDATAYLITTTPTAPAANASGWRATPPTSYTFTSGGAKTLYGWARDAAGNISESVWDNVDITNSGDKTPPVVTSFSIPSSSSTLTVPIRQFTATDNTAVTGYLVTTTSTKPVSSDPKWSSARPTGFTFTSTGTKRLYPWAKDAAGNVSSIYQNATVIITAPTPEGGD